MLIASVYFLIYAVGIGAYAGIGQGSLIYLAVLGVGALFALFYSVAGIYRALPFFVDAVSFGVGLLGIFAILLTQLLVSILDNLNPLALSVFPTVISSASLLSPYALALWYGFGGVAEEALFNLGIFGFLAYSLRRAGIFGILFADAATAIGFPFFHYYVILPLFPGITGSPVSSLFALSPSFYVTFPGFLLTPYAISLAIGRVILNHLPDLTKSLTGRRTVLSSMIAHFGINFFVTLV